MLSKKELEKYKNIDLTPDVLRGFKGCEHYSDEEAEEILASLRNLAHLAIDMYKQGIGLDDVTEVDDEK